MVPYSITIYFVSSFYPFKFSLLRDIHEQSSDCVQPYFTIFFFLTNININLIFTLIIKLASLFGLMVFNKTKYIPAFVKQAGLFCVLWIKCDFFLLSDSTVAIHSRYEHFLEDIIYIGIMIEVL